MNKLLSGVECSEALKDTLKDKIATLKRKPKLAVIRIGNDEASIIYVRNKKKTCESVGIEFEEIILSGDVCEKDVISRLNLLNNDTTIDAILVQLPIPGHLNEDRIINTINYKKDVDGLTSINMSKLSECKKGIVPCTAKGIMELLKYYKIELEGKNVVLVGRSKLIGKPLIPLLLNKNATLTICHSKTKNIEMHTKNADIIIIGIGKSKFLKRDMVKDNSIIIDVGINRDNGKIVGDVDFENIFDKVKQITPVPKGVGLMTTISVVSNVIECYLLNTLKK